MKVLSKRILAVLLLSICFSEVLDAKDSFSIAESDSITNLRLHFFNNLSHAAGLKTLSESKDSDKIQIRLSSPSSHSLAAQFLDITFDGESSEINWYIGWSDWGDDERRAQNAERFRFTSEINRIQVQGGGVFAACKLAVAEAHEVELIKNRIESTNLYNLVRQPIERRTQIDGSSLHIELLDSTGYRFASFMGYHLRNHPDKEHLHKIREFVFMWNKTDVD